VAKVSVEPRMLKWAFLRSARSQAQLEKAFPQATSWFDGSHMPTFEQLEDFAAFTYTPVGYFFLENPPEEEPQIPFCSTTDLGKNPTLSINLAETIQIMQARQDWMRDYLLDEEAAPLDYVGSLSLGLPSTSAATEIREQLKLPANWPTIYSTWEETQKAMQAAIEKSGIALIINGIVRNDTQRRLNPNEFRGFVLTDDYAPLLFINGADSTGEQLFTLAHGLAHIFLGQRAIFHPEDVHHGKEKMERKCEEIAAEFLVPKLEFGTAWKVAADPYNFAELARQLKVSEQVVARRALDLGYIGKGDFFESYQELIHQNDSEDAYDNDRKNQVGKLFGERIIAATRGGKMLYLEAYRLTDLYGAEFEEFVASLDQDDQF